LSDLQPKPGRVDPVAPGTETCGCCAGVEPRRPAPIENRPGLSAIAYRVGTYSSIRASLHAGLFSSQFPRLSTLLTREDDDFTLALLDAVACTADVLTFYQDRIANESYLRTAREKLSLQEMGRLIGYRLRPGTAAETWLAFTLETPPEPPASMKPEPGMFVSGVPRQVTVNAGVSVRSVPAPGALPQVFETVEAVVARPEWNAIQPWMSEFARPGRGAVSTFFRGVNTNLRPGDALLFVGQAFLADRSADTWDFRIVSRVVADVAQDRTFVSWERPLESLLPPQEAAGEPLAFALRRRASIYGHNAPAWGSMPADFRTAYEAAFPRASESGPVILFAAAVARQDWPRLMISPDAGSVDLDTVHSEIASGSFVVLAKGAFNAAAESVPPDMRVELYTVTRVTEVSREEFALSGKVTRLALDGANLSEFANEVRGTSVFGQSEPLAFTHYPVRNPISASTIPVNVSADGFERGRRILVRGVRERDGVAIVHVASIRAVLPVGGPQDHRCVLEIEPPLPSPLRRESVVVHANVALATHGESVTQILGSGAAALPFQRFELKQLPLTFRAAANELGAASELTVRVDEVAWKERETLFGSGPSDRVFTVLDDEHGRQFVQFGDGVRGARPSTGSNNVRALYRKGSGAAGNVAADSLTQLMTRPVSVKGVSNPLRAEGGTDPEGADLARQTMPLMTRTLGRAVSVVDYEDFARAYSGVAKARAQVLRVHTGPTIVVTIAGPAGTIISPQSPVWINLRSALLASGDPHVAVRLIPHLHGTFRIGLTIKIDPDHEQTKVLAAVEGALRTAFGFDARELGQPVHQSEVIAVAQHVPGVVAVDLDLFYRTQGVPSRHSRLLSHRMTVQSGQPVADEVLTLDPAPFDHLGVMQ
jgi:hypothetical protein